MKYDEKRELLNLTNHLLDLKNLVESESVSETTKEVFKKVDSMADNILTDITNYGVNMTQHQAAIINAKVYIMNCYVENYYKEKLKNDKNKKEHILTHHII